MERGGESRRTAGSSTHTPHQVPTPSVAVPPSYTRGGPSCSDQAPQVRVIACLVCSAKPRIVITSDTFARLTPRSDGLQGGWEGRGQSLDPTGNQPSWRSGHPQAFLKKRSKQTNKKTCSAIQVCIRKFRGLLTKGEGEDCGSVTWDNHVPLQIPNVSDVGDSTPVPPAFASRS